MSIHDLAFQMTINREMDDGSDLDEPMASQSADSEAPLTHNSSKSNFFPGNSSGSDNERSGMLANNAATNTTRGSFKNTRGDSYNTSKYPSSAQYTTSATQKQSAPTSLGDVELRTLNSAGGLTSPNNTKSIVGAVPTPFMASSSTGPSPLRYQAPAVSTAHHYHHHLQHQQPQPQVSAAMTMGRPYQQQPTNYTSAAVAAGGDPVMSRSYTGASYTMQPGQQAYPGQGQARRYF